MGVKNFIKRKLTYEQLLKTRFKIKGIKSLFFRSNLTKLAQIHQTDKYGSHFYTPHYQLHLSRFRLKKINFLEIGVGGYSNPLAGGESLRMWKSYFPFAKVVSIDIYDKSFHEQNRIKIYKGSQIDEEILNVINAESGPFDVIIDDGSHVNEHVIKTFEILFPKLKMGGIYVVEDTQTSYWESYGGTSNDFNKEGTIYQFFKSLIDSLNSEEFILDSYERTYYDKHIVSMHFYHNLIFIYKGNNSEGSNAVKNSKFL
jgi:hypothetical protein